MPKIKENMIKTSIDLTPDQYRFLKTRALERKMRGEDPSFVSILREMIDDERSGKVALARRGTPKTKDSMIKTSIDLAPDQYSYLKNRALERKLKGEDPSFVSILRDLIEGERLKSKG